MTQDLREVLARDARVADLAREVLLARCEEREASHRGVNPSFDGLVLQPLVRARVGLQHALLLLDNALEGRQDGDKAVAEIESQTFKCDDFRSSDKRELMGERLWEHDERDREINCELADEGQVEDELWRAHALVRYND